MKNALQINKLSRINVSVFLLLCCNVSVNLQLLSLLILTYIMHSTTVKLRYYATIRVRCTRKCEKFSLRCAEQWGTRPVHHRSFEFHEACPWPVLGLRILLIFSRWLRTIYMLGIVTWLAYGWDMHSDPSIYIPILSIGTYSSHMQNFFEDTRKWKFVWITRQHRMA